MLLGMIFKRTDVNHRSFFMFINELYGSIMMIY